MARRAAKIDDNQPAIVAEFERLGCAVKSTAAMGDGFPDLIVWARGNRMVECKGKRGKLTPDQVKFCEEWPGPIHIVRNGLEVRALVQEWQQEKRDG